MKKFLCLLFAAMLLLGMTGCAEQKEVPKEEEIPEEVVLPEVVEDDELSKTEPKYRISDETYDKLKFGISYAQACEILGKEGVEGEANLPAYSSWRYDTYFDNFYNIENKYVWECAYYGDFSGVVLQFVNDKMTMKEKHMIGDPAKLLKMKDITYDHFLKLERGMTYQKVTEILGGELPLREIESSSTVLREFLIRSGNRSLEFRVFDGILIAKGHSALFSDNLSTITEAQYEKVEYGMRYKEVCDLFGSEGVPSYEQCDEQGNVFSDYNWKISETNRTAIVHFVNGKVMPYD